MIRFKVRAVATALALTTALAAVPSAQQPPAAAASQTPVTAADAAPVLGDWTITMETPNGPAASTLSVRVEAEKVVADITSERFPKTAISKIVKDGTGFVLTYSLDFQGQAVPARLTMTPKGDGYAANFDFGAGQFQMDGSAAKAKK